MAYIKKRLKLKGHAVIVLAEGAGEKLLVEQENAERDASGNRGFPQHQFSQERKYVEETQELTLKLLFTMIHRKFEAA